MTDLFPTEPPTTKYTPAFESCWRVHRVGSKLKAWKAGEKAGWSDGNWLWLEQYLTKRWKDDAKWIEGKYIPHLASIINGERWTDDYKKISKRYDNTETPEESHEEALRKIQIAQRKWGME